MLGAEPDIGDVPVREPGDGAVLALVYADVPERGFVTGFTYGLSPFLRVNGQAPARELCITMRSTDPAWARVPALTVAALRGLCPFDPGMVVGYKKPYVPPSGLSSLVLASAPPSLSLTGPLDVTAPGAQARDLVEIIGAYPVYSSERIAAHAQGLGVLFDSEWDPYDPCRPVVV
ncbi:hypothetical protein [Streptomyces turgidiscabies]|uniref:Suppressor of fused-like domain-containing protein n=1 Tax=Streptomyces turgidiscabies TaxID=85558 RepID=A0ABU0RQ71_9ACTN|nr:hypothetical protein [Streptomyces turgidiscabies]MDQ0933317.1 hypothetical protein [Streptomyces turgidiscabies]